MDEPRPHKGVPTPLRYWLRQQLPLVLIWTNSYERLAWAPLLVLLAQALEAPEALAFAASAYSAANLVGNMLLGAASDRLGPYRVAGVSLLFLALTTLLHLAAWSAWVLVVVRAFHGFFAAAVAPTSLSAAAEQGDANSRGRVMARMGLVIALASVVASPLAGRMADALELAMTVRIQTVFLLLVGVAALAAAGQKIAGGPATEVERPEERKDEAAGPELDPRLTAFACVAGIAAMFGQNVLFYALPLKASAAGLGPAVVGGMFGAFAIGAAVAFVPPFSKTADRFGRVRPVAVGSALSAAGMYLLGVGVELGSIPLMATSLLAYGFGFGLVFPAVLAAAADGSSGSRRGVAFGLVTASFSVGAIVGPLLGQALDPLIQPFTLASLVMLSAALVARFVRVTAAPALSGRA